jgi:hypothetical protein
MGNQSIKYKEPYIVQDLWKDIFEYLEPEDILSCSLVCKHFYHLNLNNQLWFRKILQKKLYLHKNVTMTHPVVCYYPKLNYKKYYLSLFHHPYQFGLHIPYVNLKNDYHRFIDPYSTSFQIKNKLIFFCIYAPIQILLFPVYGILEIADYINYRKYSKIQPKILCQCKVCSTRQNITLHSIQ